MAATQLPYRDVKAFYKPSFLLSFFCNYLNCYYYVTHIYFFTNSFLAVYSYLKTTASRAITGGTHATDYTDYTDYIRDAKICSENSLYFYTSQHKTNN